MRDPSSNHYARAFESWLRDNFIRYIAVDQQKRAAFSRSKIKSFDYVFYHPAGKAYLAEVKGRKFTGKTLAGLSSLQNWVTVADVVGLSRWMDIFGQGHNGVFVFVYSLEKIDVESDGRDIYEFDGRRYVFFVVSIADYMKCMKKRSQKWETVYMPAEDFRRCAVSLEELLV